MSQAQAYWGFPIDPELHAEALATISRIHAQQDADRALSAEAARIVNDLTAIGLQHYYQIPADSVPMHPRMRKAADAGVNLAMTGIQMAIRQFFKQRSPEELSAIAAYLEPMLWTHPDQQRPYLVFVLDDDLHQRATALLQRVREDSNHKDYVDDIVDALCELVDHSVVNYYQQPSDRINLRGLTRKSIDFGIGGAQKGIRALIDKLMRELSHKQLKELSYHLESMIHRVG